MNKKLFFIPTEENRFKPKVFSTPALILYALLVMFSVGVLYPLYRTNYNEFFATLTQTLIVDGVNPERQNSNLLPLKANVKLQQAAQMKAEDMIARNYFAHNSPTGERPWIWLDKVGYKYALAGENLAMDFYDPGPLVAAWLNSPSHAKNIYNGYFTDIGIGIAQGKINNEDTVVVTMFLGKELTPQVETLAAQVNAQKPQAQSPSINTEQQISNKFNESSTKIAPISENIPEVKSQSVDTKKEEMVADSAKVETVNEVVLRKENESALKEYVPQGTNEVVKNVKKFKAATQYSAVKFAAKLTRLSLTAYFLIILLWLAFVTFMYRKKTNFLVNIFRGGVLIALIVVMWT